ncbi:MAG: hypothetical protein ACYDDT_00590 [Sulfuricella sp.]
MSFLDRQQGELDGSWATARRYGAAIDEWEAHANRLQGRLQAATNQAEELEKKRLFEEANVEGLRAVISAMETEIRRSNPNSSLLQKTTKTNIVTQRMAEFLAPQGYHYDRQTYQVSKVSR